ncbi:MAG: 4Fe-4S dicluster domain-containing protein, partial [Desulfobacteraceae bacterium]|nr:4Fe-4S dicluster domain-containing protein [Desulfobacteraceae bacterium]
ELEEYGLKDAGKCHNCGTCTATCDLATPENPFPRKMVRYSQLGQRDKILTSPEPWLCYYCGDCSVRCPRGADPGESMMVLRRYLTSLYDWTGFARKFYTSETFEIVAVTIVGLLVGLGMIIFRTGPANMEHPFLNSVWPSHAIEKADLVMAAVLTFFLLSNVYRCIKIVLGDYFGKIPLGLYVSEFKELLLNFCTQKEFGKCKDRKQWIVHLAIMTGYASVFLMVVVLINGLGVDGLKFQRDWPEYSFFHPIRLIGYYATFAIMYGTTYAIIGRLKKSKPPYQNSHPTDWMFLILLQLTTLTGILVHFTRLLDMPMPTYVIYVIHMMVAIPMLVLEVPFAKWAHLAYRPVVLFLLRVRAKYIAGEQAGAPALSPKPAA